MSKEELELERKSVARKYSQIENPSAIFYYRETFSKVKPKIVDVGVFQKELTHHFSECKIHEATFFLDSEAYCAVTKRANMQFKKEQLFYFLCTVYEQINECCILYTKKWNIVNGGLVWNAFSYCIYHDLCCLYKFQCTFDPKEKIIKVNVYRNKAERKHPKNYQAAKQLSGPKREILRECLANDYAMNVTAKENQNITKAAAEGGHIKSFSNDVTRKCRSEYATHLRNSSDEYLDLLSLIDQNYIKGGLYLIEHKSFVYFNYFFNEQ